MRALPILSSVLLTMAAPVFAQVTVDLHALQALPDRSAPPRPAHVATPAHVDTPAHVATRAPGATPSEARPQSVVTQQPPPATAGPGPTPQPAMPEAIPQTASINPVAPPEPPAGAAPPPPPPVSDTAATKAAPTAAGLRLTFSADQSDLSPESSASIKQLATAAPPGDDTTFNVQAYAPGKPDDPSTARRVSLSRAMAVRSALVADGVPSARIFVRALGDQYGSGPPDRVDIAVNTASGTAASR